MTTDMEHIENFEAGLDPLRGAVHALGWIDEGSDEQVKHFETEVVPIVEAMMKGLRRNQLEYLREQLRAGTMSYSELADLQGLAAHIEPGDVELLEAAGVPEHPFEIEQEWLDSLHTASLAVRAEIEAGIDAEGESSDLTLTLAHASIKTLEAFLGYLLGTYQPSSGTLIDKVIRTTKEDA